MTVGKLRIGALVFEIEEVEDLKSTIKSTEGNAVAGEAQPDQCRILIEKGLHPDQKVLTVFHEIVHLVLDMVGRYESEDESLVAALANGVLATLVGNPELLRVIAEMAQR